MSDEQWDEVGLNVVEFGEVGQEIEGKLLKRFEHTSKKEITYTVYEIESPGGVKEHIFGAGNLNTLMNDVADGDYIKVRFMGIQEGVETNFGVKDLRNFKLFKKKQ